MMPPSCATSTAAAICRAIHRQRPARDPLRQRLAGDVLEDEQLLAVRGLLDAVDAGDVRVVERREQLRLALEAREVLRLPRQRVREHFDRDRPLQPRIASEIDDAHAAATELALDGIRAERVRQAHSVRCTSFSTRPRRERSTSSFASSIARANSSP
jgi:hypothetical protein